MRARAKLEKLGKPRMQRKKERSYYKKKGMKKRRLKKKRDRSVLNKRD